MDKKQDLSQPVPGPLVFRSFMASDLDSKTQKLRQPGLQFYGDVSPDFRDTINDIWRTLHPDIKHLIQRTGTQFAAAHNSVDFKERPQTVYGYGDEQHIVVHESLKYKENIIR